MKPGIYYNLPFDQYRAIPALNNSTLTRLAHCPAAIQMPSEESEALNFGSACHNYVLEGKMPPVAPECDRRTKDGKATWNAFCAQNVGKSVVKADEWETIQAIHGSIYQHPTASKLLSKGKAEVTLIWKYRDLLCKARVDWLTHTGQPVDLKTTQSSSVGSFRHSVQKYGYHRQNAWYMLGMTEIGFQPSDFIFIAAEKSAPYMTNVFQLEPEWVQAGMEEIDALIDQYETLTKNNVFPAYSSPGVITLATPGYLKGE